MKKLIAFFKDEDGLETSEYAVMGALIVLATIVAGISCFTMTGKLKVVVQQGLTTADDHQNSSVINDIANPLPKAIYSRKRK